MKAAELFRKAADKGHAGAARELGYLLLQGKGEEKNAMLAAAYLRRAAGLGDMDAQYTLAGLYVEGVGVVADDGASGALVRRGGEERPCRRRRSNTGSFSSTAAAFRRTRPPPPAGSRAPPMPTIRSRSSGLPRLLAEGRGVDANPAEAARWYLIAKDHGLDDDFMEDWMQRLDPQARDDRAGGGGRLVAARRPQLQAALSPATPTVAPVDKQVE